MNSIGQNGGKVARFEAACISDILLQPPLALSVASQPVKSYSPQTSLIEILSMMDEKGYSQFPIYAENAASV